MRNMLDFSSWQTLVTTALGLLVATLLMVGIRLLFMQTIQRRRERENRQINERLKTLIAAYKTLGSSFTGELSVDPTHLKQMKTSQADSSDSQDLDGLQNLFERRRRIRDAVEGALADVILLGTQEQVELAASAARDMVEGRKVHTGELVVSLRSFIRAALDLESIPDAVVVPAQGPLRVAGAGGAGGKRGGNNTASGTGSGNKGGGANGGMGGGAGGGMAMGMGIHASSSHAAADALEPTIPDNSR